MKILFGIFGGLILAVILCFALSNRQSVEIAMWPFSGTIAVPLYMAGFIPLIAGLAVGALWGWLFSLPYLLRARRLHKEMAALNARLHELRQSSIVIPEDAPQRKWRIWKK